MFLVKCNCGCMFTIKKESLNAYNLVCQNCKSKIRFFDSSSVLESSKALEQDGVSVNYIPENAKIEVKFEM